MKQKAIFGIGCCHLFGTDHASTDGNKHPSNDVWINLLANDAGIPTYNWSQNSASNGTILRRLQLAVKFCIEKNIDPFFVLQWVNYRAFELPLEEAMYKVEEWPHTRFGHELKNKSELAPTAKTIYQTLDRFSLYTMSVQTVSHANLLLDKHNFKRINAIGSHWNMRETLSDIYIADLNTWSIDTDYVNFAQKVCKQNGYTINQKHLDNSSVISYTKHGTLADSSLESLIATQDIETYPWIHWGMPKYQGFKEFAIKHGYSSSSEKHPREHAHVAAYNWYKNSNEYEYFEDFLNN